MSPEKKIDATQKQELLTWLNDDIGHGVLKNLVIDHETGALSLTYMVGEEPLTIAQKAPLSDDHTLYFSPALAEQLKEAGILKFSEPAREK